MPFDSFVISALANELNAQLVGARIDKIYMPRPLDVVLSLRQSDGNKKLLITAGDQKRVHLTATKPENPEKPPMFCMVLRKYLGSGRILSVHQPEHERIIDITLSAADEMGFIGEKHLICELIDKKTNIILVDGANIILACAKIIDYEMSTRAVMPGLAYKLPPKQDKPMVFDIDAKQMAQIISAPRQEDDMARHICSVIGGISPFIARQVAKAETEAAAAEMLEGLAQKAQSGTLAPYLIMEDGKPKDFTVAQFDGMESIRQDSFSQMLDDFYSAKSASDSMKNAASGMTHVMRNAKSRLTRRLASQRDELEVAKGREKIKKNADLITANLYAIKMGDAQATVDDYFEENTPKIIIQLDKTLTPQQNAQRMYKKYSRMKNAEEALTQQLASGEQELEYVNNLLFTLETATTRKELEDIGQELSDGGYLKPQNGKKRPKEPAFAPREFKVAGDFTVLCGRNNRENDKLTHKFANKFDLWFHARQVPGAHVVLITDGKEPSDEAMMQAANIAAFYSSSATASRVAVDCTDIKHVKKPQGAQPGMVNYFEYKTILAQPMLPEK